LVLFTRKADLILHNLITVFGLMAILMAIFSPSIFYTSSYHLILYPNISFQHRIIRSSPHGGFSNYTSNLSVDLGDAVEFQMHYQFFIAVFVGIEPRGIDNRSTLPRRPASIILCPWFLLVKLLSNAEYCLMPEEV
jgi:hypothetical protein